VGTQTVAETAAIARLQARLAEAATVKIKNWWERYLKGAIAFRGVKMADVRAAVHAWAEAEDLSDRLSPREQVDLSLGLLHLSYAEDKIAGILYLQEVLLPAGAIDWRTDLPRLAALFDQGQIADWNTCDWLCVKFLGPLAQREGEACARAIAAWREAANLWRTRASAVAFVNLAKAGEANFQGFTEMVLESCRSLVRRSERFAQTGAGWVLRELSRAEPQAVIAFVKAHREELSREACERAIGRLPTEMQERLRAQG
jgi:3-methyladenine DNA glycosylase AlkD